MQTDVWYDLALRELAGEIGSADELLRDAELAQAGSVQGNDPEDPRDTPPEDQQHEPQVHGDEDSAEDDQVRPARAA